MKFDLNFGPAQSMITKEKIVEMISWEPRRFSLRDFEKPLKKPGELGPTQTDWNLIFPFWETFVPAFDEMCAVVDHIPFRSTKTAYFTFLKNVTTNEINQVTSFLEAIEPMSLYVIAWHYLLRLIMTGKVATRMLPKPGLESYGVSQRPMAKWRVRTLSKRQMNWPRNVWPRWQS